MGAWGHGPFDSDGALDFLGGLAEEVAELDEEYEVIPGSVDRNRARTGLLDALQGGEGDRYAQEEAYAAAGLVAAVLSGHGPGEVSGTRLLASLAGEERGSLGLEAHCGYVALLDEEGAQVLRAEAVRACEQLRAQVAGEHHAQVTALLGVLERASGQRSG